MKIGKGELEWEVVNVGEEVWLKNIYFEKMESKFKVRIDNNHAAMILLEELKRLQYNAKPVSAEDKGETDV